MKRHRQSFAALALSLLAGACQPQTAGNPPPTPPPVAIGEPPAPAPTAAPEKPGGEESLPAELALPGKSLVARRFRDTRGDNLLLVSREGPFAEKQGADEKGARLHAALYTKKNDAFELVWKLFDEERDCPFDLSLELLPGTTEVTDLDGDGTSEVTLVYKKACRSDVSPANMKLILREEDAKYALRGEMCPLGKMPFDVVEPCCGQIECKYESERDFQGAPPAFLLHARKVWVASVRPEAFEQR